MIPNHSQFVEALTDRKKVGVRCYSLPDSGVLDCICAPMSYGPGEIQDGLNRYWLWDYASPMGVHTLGFAPKQIVDQRELGEIFSPAEFTSEPALAPASQAL